MACGDEVTYIYIILVDGRPSRDGYFLEEEQTEAERVSRKYEQYHSVSVRKIKHYAKDLT